MCASVAKRTPLELGERIEVTDMAGKYECEHDIYVEIQWNGTEVAVPLSQIKALDADEDTVEAIEDWHYWKNCGYSF